MSAATATFAQKPSREGEIIAKQVRRWRSNRHSKCHCRLELRNGRGGWGCRRPAGPLDVPNQKRTICKKSAKDGNHCKVTESERNVLQRLTPIVAVCTRTNADPQINWSIPMRTKFCGLFLAGVLAVLALSS